MILSPATKIWVREQLHDLNEPMDVVLPKTCARPDCDGDPLTYHAYCGECHRAYMRAYNARRRNAKLCRWCGYTVSNPNVSWCGEHRAVSMAQKCRARKGYNSP